MLPIISFAFSSILLYFSCRALVQDMYFVSTFQKCLFFIPQIMVVIVPNLSKLYTTSRMVFSWEPALETERNRKGCCCCP